MRWCAIAQFGGTKKSRPGAVLLNAADKNACQLHFSATARWNSNATALMHGVMAWYLHSPTVSSIRYTIDNRQNSGRADGEEPKGGGGDKGLTVILCTRSTGRYCSLDIRLGDPPAWTIIHSQTS